MPKYILNRIFLKIQAALTPMVKINANFCQQKPLVTKTHVPLKEKNHLKIYTNILLRITKQVV